jgi:anion-transporting  ArsA/GET3 family ATPase
MSQRILICCGAGGVGKTTTSAALALRLALDGQKVAVITIDPALRLADALGIENLSNTPQSVPLEDLSDGCTGQLDAMMLDMKATFDSIIRRHSPNEEVQNKLLQSRYYRIVSEKLAGSQEFMAMERLYQLHTEGQYDVIVVDTPPAQNAVDFLKAPKRLAGVMSEGVVKWMSRPKDKVGFRLLERSSHTIMAVMKKLVGHQTVSEIAEFFSLISELAEGFRLRSMEMIALLESENSAFVLISAASPAARAESVHFLKVLQENRLPFGGAIVNRVHKAPKDPKAIPKNKMPPCPPSVDAELWREVCEGFASLPPLQAQLAAGDARYCAALADNAPVWTVPQIDIDIHDLKSLVQVSDHLKKASEHLVPKAL